jgi:DNA polymerase
MADRPIITMDFETRSAADLGDVGSWRYAEHPTTSAMCLAYHLPGEPKDLDHVRLWHMAHPDAGIEESPPPDDLFHAIEVEGYLVEAHNAWFERGIWTHVMTKRHGWPAIQHEQWRCSAAKASALALPRALENLVKILRLPVEKDMVGNKLMKKLSKPKKLLKRERLALEKQGIDPASRIWWHELPEDLERNWLYCRRDVLAELFASEAMPDLSLRETEVYLLDQRINERGVHVDRDAVTAALSFVERVCGSMIAELAEMTRGEDAPAGLAPTQRAKMLGWLNGPGGLPHIADTQGATVDAWLLRNDLLPEGRRALEIMRAVNRTSTAKYYALRDYRCEDGSAHGMLLYHGASTGRWAGSGPQPHNFPRGDIKDMEKVWKDILLAYREEAWDWLEFLYGDVMELLSHAARGAITADPGHELVVADFSAIEARVVLWLAGEERALDVFRRGECIYCDMATDIYKRPVNKKDHPTERQMGKQAILGLGFQMGAPKFVDTVAKYGIMIELDFAKQVVDAYRKKYPGVKSMWWDQEAAAIQATKSPGRVIRCGKIQWRVKGRFLQCRLPSGRLLSYCDPVVISKTTPWGAQADCLTFMSVHPKTKQWWRGDTYGGTLVENIVQATARDLMAEAMLRAEATGLYECLLTVHDEIVAQVPAGQGSVKEFEALMCELPSWAEGCPINAEGWRGVRYRK